MHDAEIKLEQLSTEVNDRDLPVLFRAAREGHTEIVAQLLAQSPEMVDEVDSDGNTPLYYAARRGHVEFVKQLLAHKPALVDIKAFHFAVSEGHGEVVALLLAYKPEVIEARVFLSVRWNVLHYAAAMGHGHIVEQLFALKPSLIDEPTLDGTALHLVSHAGHDGVVAKLLALRPSLCDMKNRKGRTALHVAARHGNEKVVERLLAHSQHLYLGPDNSSRTPLHYAVKEGHGKVVARLLAYDPTSIVARDSQGNNALHLAAGKGKADMVALLLAHSPELIDSKNSADATALHFALLAPSENSIRILSQLLAVRPSLVHEVDSKGRTALFLGALRGDGPVKLLLPLAPEQVFLRTPRHNNTLLHSCLSKRDKRHNSKPLNSELIERVWRMNPEALFVANTKGNTPLHLAAANHEWAFEFFQWKFPIDDIVQALLAGKHPQAEALQRVRPLVVGECNGPLLKSLHQDLVDTVYEFLGLERRARKRKHEGEEEEICHTEEGENSPEKHKEDPYVP